MKTLKEPPPGTCPTTHGSVAQLPWVLDTPTTEIVPASPTLPTRFDTVTWFAVPLPRLWNLAIRSPPSPPTVTSAGAACRVQQSDVSPANCDGEGQLLMLDARLWVTTPKPTASATAPTLSAASSARRALRPSLMRVICIGG